MNFLRRLVAVAILLAPALTFADDEFEAELAKALSSPGTPLPLLADYQPGATLDDAYATQFRSVAADRRELMGFKAGLTTPAAQGRFGVAGPVAGALLVGMSTKGPVQHQQFARLMIEMEIGFVLSRDVTASVSAEEARSLVASTVAVIELPDLGFTDPASLNGPSIVAANVSARQVIVGEVLEGSGDVNALSARLLKDGVLVTAGVGSDAMGDQYVALAWLINRSIESGYSPKAGHLLITGALGAMTPGEAGKYVAEYGGHTTIRFVIE